jgi:hypothetical protein
MEVHPETTMDQVIEVFLAIQIPEEVEALKDNPLI